MRITLTFVGRLAAATPDVPDHLDLADGCRLGDAVAALRATAGNWLHSSCLISVNGQHQGTIGTPADVPLRERDELLLIAPVAGG